MTIEPVGQLAVAGADGVLFLGPSGGVASTVTVPGGTTSVALVSGVDDGTQIYATSPGEDGTPVVARISVTGDDAKDGPNLNDTFPLPGPGERIVFDEASELVEVLGARPDGDGTTIYVLEPHGDPPAVFADHQLAFDPTAWVLDHNPDFPTDSRGAILAFSAEGEAAAVDVGHYHFAWRLPGVILGALTVGVLFLLARVLFARREVGILVGLFVLLDGMFFVQSRIAMNDVYTGFFILAAYLLFAWLWIERRRTRCVLGADARDRPAARPRARLEVGGRVRDRRARDPDPRPLGAGPDHPHRRASSASPACWAGWRWPSRRTAP